MHNTTNQQGLTKIRKLADKAQTNTSTILYANNQRYRFATTGDLGKEVKHLRADSLSFLRKQHSSLKIKELEDETKECLVQAGGRSNGSRVGHRK